jgi:carbamoyltransferase
MGLAPYGQPEAEQTLKWVELMKRELIDIKPDGSVRLNQAYFRYAVGDRMVHEARWEQLLGIPPRSPEAPLTQEYCNLALALQMVTEEAVLKMAAHAVALTGCRQLCLAGGVALNCVANGKLLRSGIVDDLWIQPAAGDAGGALGAALAAHYLYFRAAGRQAATTTDGMQGAYLGPEFSEQDIALVARKYQAVYQRFDDFDELARHTAQLLAEGQVVGWYQGRQEFGPRALGNRSILGDARNPEMQRRLNLKIKFREGFRPFAPSVLAEEAGRYFQLDRASPYMLLVAPVREAHRQELPPGYAQMPMREKLDVQRSTLPAITHIDFSARIQTVHADTNPRYYRLLQAFKETTGQGLVVNTSFNVRGEPVVCSPEEAFRCFVRTQMDHLVMGNYLFDKNRQPDNPLMKEAAAESFNLD